MWKEYKILFFWKRSKDFKINLLKELPDEQHRKFLLELIEELSTGKKRKDCRNELAKIILNYSKNVRDKHIYSVEKDDPDQRARLHNSIDNKRRRRGYQLIFSGEMLGQYYQTIDQELDKRKIEGACFDSEDEDDANNKVIDLLVKKYIIIPKQSNP